MSRWLSVLLLLSALLGFGAALSTAQAMPSRAVEVVSVDHTQAMGMVIAANHADEGMDGGSAPAERPLSQAEAETAVDGPVLFEAARSPQTLLPLAATPSRFGWTPVASPYLEGLQRPPRRAHAPA